MPSVFISYSHDPGNPEHAERVLGLAASLLRDGLTVFIDQNRSADEENIPWPIWMEDRIGEADNVLLVCTELYWIKVRQKVPNDVGHGVCWEANPITTPFTGTSSTRASLLPSSSPARRETLSPGRSKGPRTFLLDSPSGYKRLFAFLTGQRLRFPKQGAQLPVIAEEEVEPLFPTPEAIPGPRPVPLGGVEKRNKSHPSAVQGIFAQAEEAARFVQSQRTLRPRIALLLSTAFDSIADQLTDATTMRYETIPHFPRTNSSSRAGGLVIGKLAECRSPCSAVASTTTRARDLMRSSSRSECSRDWESSRW